MIEDISKNTTLLNFINSQQNWKDILKAAPFHITVRENGEYVLLKYSQYDSDMSYLISQQCRGCILRQDENGQYIYVCRPFDKFFNYGEEYAAEIDWQTARVTEKVDGSICKVWYDKGNWHLSTNGIINAFEAPAGEKEITFGDIFERALCVNIETFGCGLDKNRTYIFELTSPETQVVIPYSDGVYYLASRVTSTGEELFDKPSFISQAKIKYPKLYYISSLDDVIAAAALMTKDEEGFVVNDATGRRIKVKSPEYLIAAHMQIIGAVTNKRIFTIIKNDRLDDFLAYVPDKKDKVENVLKAIDDFCRAADAEWEEINGKNIIDQKEFANEVKKSKIRSYLFSKRKNPELSAREWLLKIAIKSAMELTGLQ